MKIRKIISIILVFLLVFSIVPIPPQNTKAAEQTDVVKTNITVPNHIATSPNGEKWYASSRSPDLGTVDISTLNLPPTATVKEVMVLDKNGTYVKHLFDKTGTVYKIGTVPAIGEETLTSDVQTGVGYFEWFPIAGFNNYWAFDLDGVRHIREYGHATDYPLPYGKYGNRDKADGLPSAFHLNGNIPTWYSYSHPNYLKVFHDETPGRADIGWAERNLDLSSATFNNPLLGINGLAISKLDNVNIEAGDIQYIQPQNTGAVHSSNILEKVVMEDSATMIANRRAKIWFSAIMSSDYHKVGTNLRYYNQWKVKLTSKIYKYSEYQVVVKYDGEPRDADLTLTADVPTCPMPNETIQIRAKITKKDGFVWEFLTTTPHAKLAYKSSNTTVATVSNTGLITIKSAGNVVISATYTEGDGSEPLVEKIDINISTPCDPTTTPPPPPSGGGGTCDYIISSGSGGSMQQSFLNASPTGFIESETGEFDVVQGIPSSELLKTQATMPKYLFDQVFEKQTGKITYTVTVTKNFVLTWLEEQPAPPPNPNAGPNDPPPVAPPPLSQSDTASEEVQVQVEREFSYWTVKKFDVWTADNALITNYALPDGQSLMMVNDKVTAQAVNDSDPYNHVFPTDCSPIELPSETLDGGYSKPSVPDIEGDAKSAAEGKITPPNVKNDKAVFNGTTLMSDSMTSGGHAPSPSNIPLPTDITVNKNNLLIDGTKTNYWQAPSEGKITYNGVFGLTGNPSNKEFNFPVNVVTVHTPVVLYANVSDDKEHDQRISPPNRSAVYNPNSEIAAFVLDRVVTVYLPTSGQHRNIPGYGNRDYQKYIKTKQVRFPFDIYSETEAAYYPANTWINIPVDLQQANFKMPSWVTEGRYVIDFRAFAINAPETADFGGTEKEANISIPNGVVNGNPSAAHSVEDSITVDVIGRLFDLKVTDITDYNWQDVFREQDGLTHSGNNYTVGLGDIDGASNGNTQLYTLPISHYSHPSRIKNLATKLGYSFRFDLKTKGEMQWNNDAIRITPKFYFVKNDGSGRQEVDLYYHDKENEKYFIKIGSDDDLTYRTIKLNEVARNVSTEELTNNAVTYYDYADKFNLDSLKNEYYKNTFGRYYIRHLSKENVETGPYGWQILNWKLRTFINEVPTNMTTTMIPKDQIVMKEQQWYGEYSLPAETYVVPKGTKIQDTAILSRLNENHPLFLRDGYIIVNFDIETIRDGNVNQPYLSYYKGYYANQWRTHEKGKTSFTDGYGNTFSVLDGDMIYYYANQTSQQDFKASITH